MIITVNIIIYDFSHHVLKHNSMLQKYDAYPLSNLIGEWGVKTPRYGQSPDIAAC